MRSTAIVQWCFEEPWERGRFAPVSALKCWISGRVFRWHAAQIRCYHQQEHSLGTQMGFLEILTLAAALLEHEKRISCRALQRIFDLDDRALEDLRFELVRARGVASDEGDGILVWTGGGARTPLRPSVGPIEPVQQAVAIAATAPEGSRPLAAEPTGSGAERRS
jgi:hypothetical protein